MDKVKDKHLIKKQQEYSDILKAYKSNLVRLRYNTEYVIAVPLDMLEKRNVSINKMIDNLPDEMKTKMLKAKEVHDKYMVDMRKLIKLQEQHTGISLIDCSLSEKNNKNMLKKSIFGRSVNSPEVLFEVVFHLHYGLDYTHYLDTMKVFSDQSQSLHSLQKNQVTSLMYYANSKYEKKEIFKSILYEYKNSEVDLFTESMFENNDTLGVTTIGHTLYFIWLIEHTYSLRTPYIALRMIDNQQAGFDEKKFSKISIEFNKRMHSDGTLAAVYWAVELFRQQSKTINLQTKVKAVEKC